MLAAHMSHGLISHCAPPAALLPACPRLLAAHCASRFCHFGAHSSYRRRLEACLRVQIRIARPKVKTPPHPSEARTTCVRKASGIPS
eukprot:COSAG01_NODE_1553_length_9931_cov_3.092657_4_plen_87_part_00